MNKNIALRVAGVIFAIVALLHLLRLLIRFEVIVEGRSMPLLASVIAMIVTGLLAIWMFAAAK